MSPIACGSCGQRRAKLQGRTPTSSKMVAWVVVMSGSGDVSEYGSEIEARAALAASGGRGNVVRKRA